MQKVLGCALLAMTAAVILTGCATTARDWKFATTLNDARAYEAFLLRHPDSEYDAEARARIEELDWKFVQGSGSLPTLRWYVAKHPETEHAKEAGTRIVASMKTSWEEAKATDKVYAYVSFARDYPESEHVASAQERASWQRAHRAQARIDYPRIVTGGSRYAWETKFAETSGNAGFTLRAENFYILSPSGSKWSNSWSPSVEVAPRGTATNSYWCDRSDKWAGGDFYTTWVGEDTWGNPISLQQSVHLDR
jgi:hypothetical protein